MSDDLQYFHQTIRRAVMMERVKAYHVKQLPKLLKTVDDYLSTVLYTADSITAELATVIEAELYQIYKDFGENFIGSMVEAFIDSYEYEYDSVQAVYKDKNHFHLAPMPNASNLSRKALQFFVVTPLLLDSYRGKTFKGLLKDFSVSASQAVANSLRASVYEGKTAADIKKDIKGTKSLGYRDGVLAATSRHAEALVRTGIQQADSFAKQQFADDNAKLITGIQIIAILDSRTSKICRSLSNKVFPINKAKYPPFHMNCRSTFIYVFNSNKGYGDIENVSYYEWLKSQPTSFQDEVLGKVRARLLRDGGLSAQDFADLNLDKNFEPLTLAEMKKLNPLAFEKAKMSGYDQ